MTDPEKSQSSEVLYICLFIHPYEIVDLCFFLQIIISIFNVLCFFFNWKQIFLIISVVILKWN